MVLGFLIGYWLGYESGDKRSRDSSFYSALAVCVLLLAAVAGFMAMSMDPVVMVAGVVVFVALSAWAVILTVHRRRRNGP